MKRKLVLWGANEKDEKLLLALELNEEKNEVNIYSVPEEAATQDLYTDLTGKWKSGQEIAFPENHTKIVRPLTVAESLLPDNIKVDRTDVISRAQAEWHFIVLSAKMYEIYKSELGDIKEKVDNVSEYSDSLWNELKGYWTKVLEQVKEKTLFREHANSLKETTNTLFDRMKELRKESEALFEKKSKEIKASYIESLDEIEGKIDKGLGFKPIFDDLKGLQNKLKKEELTRGDRNNIWNRIDKAFKKIKEVKFGDSEGGSQNQSGASRLERRYKGLQNAISKMEQSIKRDKNELDFQNKRINSTGGQLEMQLRQAKHAMILERVNSKQEKLDDMYKTKVDLEKKIEVEKKRDEERARKQEVEEAKKAAKEKIAADMKEQKESIEGELGEKIAAASTAIAEGKVESKKAVDAAIESVAPPVREVAEKVVSTPEPTVEAKVEEKQETVSASEVATETVVEKKEEVEESTVDKAMDFIDDMKVNVMAAATVLKDKIEDAVDYVEDKVEEIKDKMEEE